ncbi:uncharacterized protein LOC131658622 [Vicia villosa]|uniref:uncharacterized protein LOC131658622 n=1 Tax=Vicia villosa TaxID=3911 RepID=UPI00273B94FC|nr:uncharacterized protein LOC131658622 [Vicia villosa]
MTKGKADIFLIQETKFKEFKDHFVSNLWSGSDIGFSYSNSIGASGGLLTLWKGDKLEVVNSFNGEGYLGIKVRWENMWYYVVNVYSSCVLDKKKLLWANLLRLIENFKDGEWIIGGDFNAVKNVNEIRRVLGDNVNRNESRLFVEFIHNSSLVDLPCKGKKFTWYSGDGKSMSRLDWFLISEEVMDRWGVVFGRYDLNVEEGKRCINLYDELLESGNEESNKEVVNRRREASCRFWKDLQIKENMLLQKSRLNWLREGDSNNGFFHKVIKERRRINHIGPILTSRGNLESVGDIKEEVFRHFKDKFKEDELERPLLDGILFNNIGEADSVMLDSPFSEEEIKEVSRRLKRVLGSVVSPCQSAFVPGRKMLEGVVVVANEVVDYARKEG